MVSFLDINGEYIKSHLVFMHSLLTNVFFFYLFPGEWNKAVQRIVWMKKSLLENDTLLSIHMVSQIHIYSEMG